MQRLSFSLSLVQRILEARFITLSALILCRANLDIHPCGLVIATLVLAIIDSIPQLRLPFEGNLGTYFYGEVLERFRLRSQFFVTILFFTQSAEAYSRGSLIFQIISVGTYGYRAHAPYFILGFRLQSRQIK